MCKYCDIQDSKYYQSKDCANVVAEGEYSNLYMGYPSSQYKQNHIQIYSYDEEGMFGFYPKYCPFCGRKLSEE